MTMQLNETQPPAQVTNEDKWTNVQVDSQVLSLFMSCPQKYEYKFERRLIPIEGLSTGIIRGTIVHDALLEYWKQRILDGNVQLGVAKALKLCKAQLEKEIKFEPDDRLDILNGLMEYLRFIQAQSWIPLAAEKPFKIKVFEDPETRLRIFITGRIDLIMRTPQLPVFPIDVKTEESKWFYSQMKNQFKMYCIALGVNLLGVQRVGFQKTLEPKDKFKLETLPFDQDILDEFRTVTLPHWTKQLIVAHEEKFFPMNPTNCIHGHFKCEFSDAYNGGICNVSRVVREQKLQRYFLVGEEWDPTKVE